MWLGCTFNTRITTNDATKHIAYHTYDMVDVLALGSHDNVPWVIPHYDKESDDAQDKKL